MKRTADGLPAMNLLVEGAGGAAAARRINPVTCDSVFANTAALNDEHLCLAIDAHSTAPVFPIDRLLLRDKG